MKYLEIINSVLTRNDLKTVTDVTSTEEPKLAQVKIYVNEVYKDILNQSLDWGWREKEGTITLVAGTTSYSLPSDCDVDSIKEIRYPDTLKTLKQLSYNEFDQIIFPFNDEFIQIQNQQTIDRPEFAYIFENKINIYPTPSSSATLKFRYQVVPSDLSGKDDEPIIPSQYHHLLAIGASAMLRVFPLNNTAGATADQSLYNDSIRRMVAHHRKFFGNKPSMRLRYTSRYFRG